QLKNEINERMQIDETLQKTNEFLDTLIKSSPLAIFSLDIKGTVLSWNEAAKKIFGWQKSEVIGRIVPNFHGTDGYGQRALQGEVFTNIELTPLKKDGLPTDISFSTAPLRDKNGNITGIIAIIADITERKKMEEELLKAQQLESIGVLAGVMAHNFNNVLTSVSGNIQLAKMKIQPETKAFDLLGSAEISLIKAQELSVQLLTFAKGGAPQKKTISISSLIKDSCTMAQQGSKSECEFSIEKDLWQVEADSGQLSLVFSNIVINASQAMPQGGIIRVAANNLIVDAGQDLQLEPGKYVHISVEDQGPGIPENNLSKIFDPYFTTKVESSGLGLAAAYSIIKNHNGHIYAKSLPGEGTVFHIYLPAFGDFIAAEEEAELLTGYGNILVMDDDKMLKIMVEEMLNVLGYESEFANDGDEAVKMYKKALESGKPYDAVMLDLTIPGGMGGKEAVKILLETDPNLKAIVFSGYSDDPVMSNHRKYGFKGMLSKPFNLESLGKALHDVLKN
ncbi:MAG: PAS domain S-box protein, partial [Proteobacteria bacterium]|nr:PAS domain S-box protein [Pseudomonadota bacterium]